MSEILKISENLLNKHNSVFDIEKIYMNLALEYKKYKAKYIDKVKNPEDVDFDLIVESINQFWLCKKNNVSENQKAIDIIETIIKAFSAPLISYFNSNKEKYIEADILNLLLTNVNAREKKIPYIINHHDEYIKNVKKVVYDIILMNESEGQVSQLYTQNKINYDNYISLKESDNWEVYINIKPINTQWIHLKLFYLQLNNHIYLKQLEKNKKYGLKNIETILKKYIKLNSALLIDPKKWYETLIIWNDLFSDEYLQNVKITKLLNEKFINIFLKYFEDVKEISKLEDYYTFLNLYEDLVKKYKSFIVSDAREVMVNITKLNSEIKNPETKLVENSKTLYKNASIKEEKSKEELLRIEVDKINSLKRKLVEIDYVLDDKWIDAFLNLLKEELDKQKDKLLREFKQVTANNYLNLNTDLTDTHSKKLKKLDLELEKIKEYREKYNFYLNEDKAYSKYVSKWDVVFELEFDWFPVLHDTDWNIIEWKAEEFFNLFDFVNSYLDCEITKNSKSIKVVAKKTWILMEKYLNNKIVFLIDSEFLEKYNFTDLSRDNYLTGFKNEEIHKYIDEWKEWLNYNERDLKNFQMLTNWIFPEEKFQEINKSHVDRLENLNYSNEQIFVSNSAKVDFLHWYWVFWKNVRIWKIENYDIPETEETIHTSIKKLEISWKRIHIKELYNNKQTINLLSDEYFWILNQLYDMDSKKIDVYNKSDFIYDLDLDKYFFLSPEKLIFKSHSFLDEINKTLELYVNRKKRLVNFYVSLDSLFTNDEDKKIFLEIEKKFHLELLNGNESMDDFIENELFKWFNVDILKSKKYKILFNIISEVYTLSNEIKLKLPKKIRIEEYLNNIENLDVEFTLNIDCNLADWLNLWFNWTSAMNYKYVWITEEVSQNYLLIPKWLGIKISVLKKQENRIKIEVNKTLDAIINQKVWLIKKEYFPVGDPNLPPQKKDLIRKEIDRIRSVLYDIVSRKITNLKTMEEVNNNEDVEKIFWKTLLANLYNESRKFEKTNSLKKTIF